MLNSMKLYWKQFVRELMDIQALEISLNMKKSRGRATTVPNIWIKIRVIM